MERVSQFDPCFCRNGQECGRRLRSLKDGGKRWTGMEIVEDGDRQPRGGQEWPLHFSACVSIIAAYGGSPQGDVLLISLRARGQLGDAYQYLQGIMCHPDGELI